jgi:uncharacterized protein with GYD domain
VKREISIEESNMLFHITLIHDAANCPGYHRELMPPWLEAMDKKDEIAKRLGVKVHSILNAAPDHVVYVILEAERPMQAAMFVSQLLPTEQAEIRMHAVETFEDTAAFVQSMGPPPGTT